MLEYVPYADEELGVDCVCSTCDGDFIGFKGDDQCDECIEAEADAEAALDAEAERTGPHEKGCECPRYGCVLRAKAVHVHSDATPTKHSGRSKQ